MLNICAVEFLLERLRATPSDGLDTVWQETSPNTSFSVLACFIKHRILDRVSPVYEVECIVFTNRVYEVPNIPTKLDNS